MSNSTSQALCRILHTADWHLRDSQYASPTRGDDFTKAAMAVLDIAMGYGVSAICNCGDILNNKRPSSRNIRDLVEIDRRLQAAGIPMYVISGNHDFSRPSWISILDEETKQQNKEKTVGIIDADNKLLTIPGTGLTVYGLPALGARGFRGVIGEAPPADILMSHELVREFAAFKTDDDTLSIEDYPMDKYDLVLLGDIHTASIRNIACSNTDEFIGPKRIGYPGSIELCSKNEPVDKSVFVFEYDPGDKECEIPASWKEPQVVSVPSRKALFYRVITDDQADQALADLKKYIDQDPIILVRYDRRLHNVPTKFMTVLAGTNSILRCAAFADVNAGRLLGLNDDNSDLDNLKSLKDFVSTFIPAGTELHKLAVALADPEANHKGLINDYVHERLGNNETDSFEDPGYRKAQISGSRN